MNVQLIGGWKNNTIKIYNTERVEKKTDAFHIHISRERFAAIRQFQCVQLLDVVNIVLKKSTVQISTVLLILTQLECILTLTAN